MHDLNSPPPTLDEYQACCLAQSEPVRVWQPRGRSVAVVLLPGLSLKPADPMLFSVIDSLSIVITHVGWRGRPSARAT
jgi:hypothetical protein